MKKKITLTVLTLFIAGFTLSAQSSYVNKVIIVNEGHYDYINSVQTIPVTVGVYDPYTKVYTPFDTIQNARFATNVIVDGSSIFVAADNQLIRYNANSYKRLATTTVRGVRKLAVWNNELLVSRGEYLQTFNSYFMVYNKNNLHFLYDLPVTEGPKYATEGIIVKGDIAFVEINNGFDFGNEVGFVGRVDLVKQKYINELDLGPLGKNPEGIYNDNENIYTVNNTDYSTASISNINVSTLAVNTTNLATPTGCGASGFIPGFVMFQVAGETAIGKFSTATLTVPDTLKINRNIYGMAADNLNGLIYVGETDYTTYGKIFIYDLKGIMKGSFDVSVSPGNIALDIRTGKNNNGNKRMSEDDVSIAPANSLSCYPNPAHDEVYVVATGNTSDTFVVTDITGREVKRISTQLSGFSLDMHTFETGIYILRSLSNPAEQLKIVKQ